MSTSTVAVASLMVSTEECWPRMAYSAGTEAESHGSRGSVVEEATRSRTRPSGGLQYGRCHQGCRPAHQARPGPATPLSRGSSRHPPWTHRRRQCYRRQATRARYRDRDRHLRRHSRARTSRGGRRGNGGVAQNWPASVMPRCPKPTGGSSPAPPKASLLCRSAGASPTSSGQSNAGAPRDAGMRRSGGGDSGARQFFERVGGVRTGTMILCPSCCHPNGLHLLSGQGAHREKVLRRGTPGCRPHCS